VAPEFLLAGTAYTYAEACAFCLLHDVPVRPNDPGADLRLMAGIWRAMDEFGRTEAAWLPYWRNREVALARPAGVYASLYQRQGHGVLAVLSNLGRHAADARLTLDAGLLGLPADGAPPGLAAADAICGELLPLERRGSRVHVTAASLPPFGWRLIRVGTAVGR
jgi:hypothetical protein